MAIQSPVHAGIEGTNCWSKGQTRKIAGVKYECKLVSGKFKWQKSQTKIQSSRSTKAYANCLAELGWDPGPQANLQRNVNVQNFCYEKFYPK